jgi:hypothetical protein
MNTFRMIMIREAQTNEDNTPSIKLWPANFLKVCHSVLNALSKIRQGRKIARIALGSTLVIKCVACPMIPK